MPIYATNDCSLLVIVLIIYTFFSVLLLWHPLIKGYKFVLVMTFMQW